MYLVRSFTIYFQAKFHMPCANVSLVLDMKQNFNRDRAYPAFIMLMGNWKRDGVVSSGMMLIPKVSQKIIYCNYDGHGHYDTMPISLYHTETRLNAFYFRHANCNITTPLQIQLLWGGFLMAPVCLLPRVRRRWNGLSRSSSSYRSQACLLRSHVIDLTGSWQACTASYTSSMYRSVHLPTPIIYPHDFLMLLFRNATFISLHLTW